MGKKEQVPALRSLCRVLCGCGQSEVLCEMGKKKEWTMVPARRGPIFVHGSLWVWSACRPPNLHLGTVGDRYKSV